MKKNIAFSILMCSATLFTQAQNVGIGNTDPAYKLDMSGRMRIRGGTNDNFTAGVWLAGFGADSATNKIFMGMESDSTAGFYSELNNNGWFLVANGKNGRVGILNRNPKYPLSFDNQGGDKISLYQDGNSNYYGLGIGNNTMQLMTPHISSSIVFGYGLSNNFTENMRVGGNGNVSIGTSDISLAGITVNKKVSATHAIFGSNTTGVAIESSFPGIGLNSYFNGTRKTIATGFSSYLGTNPTSGGMQFLVSTLSNTAGATGTYKTALDIKADGKVGIGVTDPAYLLDIGERMRIRGAPGFTAGIWLNNEANTALSSFIGMQAENQVGFFGFGSAGWGLLMNTQTGAVSFGGNAGQPGQVLMSNGANSAPVWSSVGGSYSEVYQTNPVTDSPLGGFVDVPGMVTNITLTTPSKVVFNIRLHLSISACFGCDPNLTYIGLQKLVPGGTEDAMILPNTIPVSKFSTFASGPIVLNLPAGVFSYKVVMNNFGPGGNTSALMQTIGGGTYPGLLSWQIFPN